MSFLTRASRKAPLSTLVRAQSRALSSSENATETDNPRFYPVYVHHLSKVCLEHLQNTRADWLEQEGLSRGLSINNDGTFVLNFPSTDDNIDNGRIWTSYDAVKKQHYLSVYRQKLVGRFLIKDSKPGENIEAVNHAVKSTVDQMIRTLTELENKST